MIEQDFQIPFVARMALAEKQIQQNYRPLIAVHKWFARRPGTLFRSLLLAELAGRPLEQTYFERHDFRGKHVMDPFMGGGTTVMEANRLGCDITAADINPMAWWIVRQEVSDLDVVAYRREAALLRRHLEAEVGHLYKTRCPKTGDLADAKYFLWVKTAVCGACGHQHDLFPNHLIAHDVRHPANVYACGYCGDVFEGCDRKGTTACPGCGQHPPAAHTASRNRSRCLKCGGEVRYPGSEPLRHRLFAIEYHVPRSADDGRRKGRFFKAPDSEDLSKEAEAERILAVLGVRFVPDDEIPAGDETERLHRWGYRRYSELFHARQRLGLELSCRWIDGHGDPVVREALATNLSDLLRYQNMLCRYDVMALKSLDVFSVHGFPVGLIQCESNILGIQGTRGLPVGSGGWLNISDKFARAKAYCRRPFEIRHEGGRKVEVAIPGEWIGTTRTDEGRVERRHVNLICGDSTAVDASRKYDAVFTDPPYFGNVQYAELMDFCYVWLRRLVGRDHRPFAAASTRNPGELTGNANMGRDLAHFTEGMSSVFSRMATSLRHGAPLAFTYHHNKLDAYVPLAVAMLDAGLVCSASLPCPAEMGASIHINGTGSSIIDTVFVGRATGRVPRRWIVDSPQGVAVLVQSDVSELALAGLQATQGDIRCMIHGHLIRLAVWNLRGQWARALPTPQRMSTVATWLRDFGGLESVVRELGTGFDAANVRQAWTSDDLFREANHAQEARDEVSF